MLEIRELEEHMMDIEGKKIKVKFKVIPSMNDGKTRNSIYTAVLRESKKQKFK